MNADACLLSACSKSWEESFIVGRKNENNCSGFVKSVAGRLGAAIPATARADEIVDHVKKNWELVASGAEAARKAGTGTLVIAGLRACDHTPARGQGHVAVVVAGALYREKYPKVWGGSTGSAQSPGTKSVGEVWSSKDRDNVAYYAYTGTTTGCA